MEIYKSPLAQAKAQLYPKPSLDDDFYSNAHKDGYKVNGNEARLGKGRLNSLIDEYGVWNDNLDYAKAYLGFIDPREFIKGTLAGSDSITREEIENPQDLDLEKINNNSQTPFLMVDFDNNKIVGHEGRHRLSSFAKAGVNRLPIVVRDYSPSFKKDHAQKRNYKGSIKGQLFDGIGKGDDINFDSDLIPLNYKNIEDLYKIFGSQE